MQHILIDYENVQPNNFQGIKYPDDCHIWLFLGVQQQEKLPLELVESLLDFDSKKIHIIKMQHSGKNALDFYLVYYLGKISEIDNQAKVCILSKDSGFDALIEHLNITHPNIDIIRLANLKENNLPWQQSIDNMLFYEHINQENLYLLSEINNSQEQFASIKDLLAPPDNKVTNILINNCYQITLAELVTPNSYRPTHKKHLLSRLRKYLLADNITELNHTEQTYLCEQVLAKLIVNRLINIDEHSEKLTYHLSLEDMLRFISEFIEETKPKTTKHLRNYIYTRLRNYAQPTTAEHVDLVIEWLKQQEIIREQNKNIFYRPFDDEADADDMAKFLTTETLYQKSLIFLQDKLEFQRPNTIASLTKSLTVHLKMQDTGRIVQIICLLMQREKIIVPNHGKLIYQL